MKRTITGKVTSDRGDKAIVVTVTSRKTHPMYKKQYSFNTKFMAHDENNEAKVGDLVTIVESRPLSRRKHFTLLKIIEKASAGFIEADATAGLPIEETKETEPADKKTVAKKAAPKAGAKELKPASKSKEAIK